MLFASFCFSRKAGKRQFTMSEGKVKERKRDRIRNLLWGSSRPSSPASTEVRPASPRPVSVTSHSAIVTAGGSLIVPALPSAAQPRPSTALADHPSATIESASAVSLPTDLSSTGLPSASFEASEPETHQQTVVPDAPQQPPNSDLWGQAFAKANEETQKWIKQQGLSSSVMQPRDQIKELISLVEENKLSEQSDEPFKLEIENQKLIVREYVADAVAFITMVGDAAIAFAPPQAGAPWAVAKAVMKIPVKQIEQKAALLGTVRWFTRIVRRGQIYEALYTPETATEQATLSLHEALLELYIAALELLAKSDTLFESGVARQTLTAILRPDGASSSVKSLAEKEQRLDREFQSCEALRSCIASKNNMDGIDALRKQLDQLSSPLPRIDKGITSVLSIVEERDLYDLMSFISSEMFGERHTRAAVARLDGTGEWLLASREFRDWQAFPSSSAALCLKGTVGTGKTHLTSKVIDHVKQTLKQSQHDEGFAYFYCQRSGSSMQDPIGVMKSFVRQLAGRAFDSAGLVRSSLLERCETAKKDGRGLAYQDCKDLILESFNMYPKTTIVLDALDESDISTHNLGTILVELMEKSKKPVKIFISSRPDREYLENTFGDSRIITLDASNQQEDIERYLQEKLYSTPFFQQRRLVVQDKIKDVFATKSRGMFRWVNLQVNSLQRCITDNAIHAWSRNLPQNLTEAYGQLWARIEEHDASDVSLAQRAIMWVLCAREPLPVGALLEAIRYEIQGHDVVRKEEQTKQQILTLCQDLLTLDMSSGIFRELVWTLPHASVAEYFEGKGWARWECNLFAAKVSVAFLFNFYQEGGEGHFERYAEYRWWKHVKQYEEWLEGNQEVEADADLAILLERLFRSRNGGSPRYKYSRLADPQRQPDRAVLHSICEMGLWHTMPHWWLGGKITREMALMQDDDHYYALGIALDGDCLKIVEYLVGLVFATEHLQSERHTYIYALRNAVEAGKIDIVELLMTKVNLHVDVNSPGEGGASLTLASLAQLAAKLSPDILQWFISQGWVDLERENDSGFEYGNVLIAAAAVNDEDSSRSVQILLDAGVNVNAAVRNGRYGSALVAAAANGLFGTAQLLLDAGADVNATVHCGIYGNALTAAANLYGDGATDLILLLLDHGADLNMALKGGEYRSVLEAVVAQEPRKNQRALLHALLEAGMDPLAELEEGEFGIALAAAAFRGNEDMLRVMIGHVGREQAIDALRRSRHPAKLKFRWVNDFMNWQSTVEYLVEEVGMSREDLDAIGLRSLGENWRELFSDYGKSYFTLDLG
ncbi:hypothetical protein V8C44DRAFT_329716 [Trichoderma aethiopicum]